MGGAADRRHIRGGGGSRGGGGGGGGDGDGGSDGTVKCPECSAASSTTTSLRVHFSRSRERLYVCGRCRLWVWLSSKDSIEAQLDSITCDGDLLAFWDTTVPPSHHVLLGDVGPTAAAREGAVGGPAVSATAQSPVEASGAAGYSARVVAAGTASGAAAAGGVGELALCPVCPRDLFTVRELWRRMLGHRRSLLGCSRCWLSARLYKFPSKVSFQLHLKSLLCRGPLLVICFPRRRS